MYSEPGPLLLNGLRDGLYHWAELIEVLLYHECKKSIKWLENELFLGRIEEQDDFRDLLQGMAHHNPSTDSPTIT